MRKALSIKGRIQRLLILCSLSALILIGRSSLLAMMGARHNSMEDGLEIGENVSVAVGKVMRREAEERNKFFST